MDPEEQVSVLMCGFDDVRRDDYFGRKPVGRTEGKSLNMKRMRLS